MLIGLELSELTEINEYQIQIEQQNIYVPYMIQLMIF